MNKSEFLYSKSPYYGQAKPANLIFNSHLQYLSTRVSYICNLHINNKISSAKAYQEIEELWLQLEQVKYLILNKNTDPSELENYE